MGCSKFFTPYRCFIYLFCLPVSVTCFVLSANGMSRADALNVQRMAEIGSPVRVIRCDKEHTRRYNTYYLITAETLDGGVRATAEVDFQYSQIPDAGEVWLVDTTGWCIRFTKRVKEEKK